MARISGSYKRPRGPYSLNKWNPGTDGASSVMRQSVHPVPSLLIHIEARFIRRAASMRTPSP